MRETYDLLVEPTGETYRQLLLCALDYCSHLLLVVRHTARLSPDGEEILNRLQPFLATVTEQSEWPGTRLIGHAATVYRCGVTRDALFVLVDAASGLFSWRQPDRPEDPCLLRQDGTVWLATISHERDGYLLLSPEEHGVLLRRAPDLVVRSHPAEP
jgi:hypothetical protein